MHIKKSCSYVFLESSGMPLRKGLLDIYFPETHKSNFWKYWRAILDQKLCPDCYSHHGKVYAMDEMPDVEPPLHEKCRCAILSANAITAGDATKDGENGADYWLINYGKLPDYCISDSELRALGWNNGKPPKRYAPGKMYIGGVYDNDDGHLPSAPGRIWYEADINYYEGRRNKHRILEPILKLAMNGNEFTPDNKSAGKLKQGHVVGSFLLIANQKFTEAIEKRVCNLNDPAACAKIGVAFQFLLFFTSGPNMWYIFALFNCFCTAGIPCV